MKSKGYFSISVIIIAAFAVIACAGDVQADTFGLRPPSFANKTPNQIPHLFKITLTTVGYTAAYLYLDNNTGYYWSWNDARGKWLTYYQLAGSGGFIRTEDNVKTHFEREQWGSDEKGRTTAWGFIRNQRGEKTGQRWHALWEN
ncbi:MAG: hypothetical protein RDV48_25675 [Candidatus Eremiobacteraeota bacterium]|nr:hypothetical protein [Candidatus Eremiobacteraeota bacterium]